jgi:hypothetical protein
MNQSRSTPESTPEVNSPLVSGDPGVSGRSVAGLSLLLVATWVALALAWLWPNSTRVHFWLVAQGLPVFYALLAWWWARQSVVGAGDEL